jgi:hypothetical protein
VRAWAVVLVAAFLASGHRAPAQGNQDSLDAQLNAKCPGLNDSTAAWQQVLRRWHDDSTHPLWSNDSLRRVLLVMQDSDQAIRFLYIGHESDTILGRRMRDIDTANDRRMEAIIARYGWPTRALVGTKGESAAWLIVQHADSSLQARALKLMVAQPVGQVSPTELAYLTDRLRVKEHQSQLYGTQFDPLPDSGWVLHPIEDEAHVEARRARVGIEPLDEYLCTMRVLERTRVLRHPPAGAT